MTSPGKFLVFLMMLIPFVTFAQWEASIHGSGTPIGLITDSSGDRLLMSLQLGGVWLTNDGGNNWEQINDRISDSPTFMTTNHGYEVAMGSAADTLVVSVFDRYDLDHMHNYSLDGGMTWDYYDVWPWWPDSLDAIAYGGEPTYIFSDRIYFMCLTGIGLSYDHGASWEIVEYESISRGVNGVFLEQCRPDSIYVFGSWGLDSPNGGPEVGGIWGTRDGGLSWQRLTPMEEYTEEQGFVLSLTRGTTDELYALCRTSRVAVTERFILHSSDNGATWTVIEAAGFPDGKFYHIMVTPEVPGRLFLGGYNTGVWESADSGLSWNRVYRGLPEVPRYVRVFYRNEFSGHLYVGLEGQGLYRSTDYGENWFPVPMPQTGIETWQMWHGLLIEEGGVLQCGTGGDMFFAPDNSTQFQPVPPLGVEDDKGYFLAPVSYQPDTIIVSRTKNAFDGEVDYHSLMKSTDDGDSWSFSTENEFPAYDSPRWISHIESESGSAYVGSFGLAYDMSISTDEGESWETRPTPASLSYPQVHNNSIYATGVFPYPPDVYRSDDIGQTWEEMNFPQPDNLLGSVITPILFLSDTVYVRAGSRLYCHLPNGNWQGRGEMYNGGTGSFFFAWDIVTGIDDTLIVAGAYDWPVLFTSSNMGWTWDEQDIDMPGDYSKEVCLAVAYDQWRDHLWIDTGVGLAYLDHPTTHVGEDVWQFQTATYATLSAYPNPFNGISMVRYSLTRPGEVRLEVFDLLGRRVATLQQGMVMSGEHNVQFDASELSSGSYFLRLNTPEGVLNRRITLVK